MSHIMPFHPKFGVRLVWIFIQEVFPLLRNRDHILEIKERSGTRTPTINAYYFKIVIGAFMLEMGVPESESGRAYVHYDILGQELRQIPDPHRPGKTMTQRTRDMTGSEFWKYLGKCSNLFQHFYYYVYPPPENSLRPREE